MIFISLVTNLVKSRECSKIELLDDFFGPYLLENEFISYFLNRSSIFYYDLENTFFWEEGESFVVWPINIARWYALVTELVLLLI